jgi:hypothetical protein
MAGVFFLAGFGIQGKPPVPAEPVRSIASYLVHHRDRILVADCLIGVGAAIFIWFLAVLHNHLRAYGDRDGGASFAGLAGAGLGTALVLGGAALQAALVVHAGALGSSSVTRFGFDAYNALITIAGFMFAVGVGAASISAARSGALSSRLYGTGVLVAIVQIPSCAGLFSDSGFFAPGRYMALVAFWALAAWYIAVSVRLTRRAGVLLSGEGQR